MADWNGTKLHGDYVSVYLEGVNQGMGAARMENGANLKCRQSTRTTELPRHVDICSESVVSGLDYPEPAATLETSIATLTFVRKYP